VSDRFFAAPWGNTLIAMTVLGSVLLLGIPLVGLLTAPRADLGWWLLMMVLPVLIWAIAALFTIRGYVLTDDTLQVQRFGWQTTISLQDLRSADDRPQAMRHSWRLLGNGGLFSFTGKFRNHALGTYRAFVTDLEHTVVLTFPDRKIVLSPANPGEFVDSVLPRQTNA